MRDVRNKQGDTDNALRCNVKMEMDMDTGMKSVKQLGIFCSLSLSLSLSATTACTYSSNLHLCEVYVPRYVAADNADSVDQ